MSFVDDFSSAFLPAYQNSLQSWQRQQESDRRFALEQERHKADMEERGLRMDVARSQAARDKQYVDGVQGLVADRRQGAVDPTATAQKAAGLIAAQGEDYDGGRIAREMAGKVRDPNKKLKGSEFTRGLADLELQTGRSNAAGYAQAQEMAKGQQWDEDAVTHVQTWRAMTPKQRSQLLAEASKGDEIKGFFSWEPGVKGKSTYWYMRESGGRPLQLSESDAERLYTLTQLAAVDPDRAAKEIGALKGNAKQAAISMLKVQTEAVGTNNRGVDAAADNALKARELGLREKELDFKTLGSPVPMVNTKTGETAMFYSGRLPSDKNGMVMAPPGFSFTKGPRPTQFLKQEGGGGIVVDMNNRPLFRITPEGEQVPAGADPWADAKTGAANREKWESQGVARVLWEDPNSGALSYKFIDAKMDPMAQVPSNTPDEVIAGRSRVLAELGARKPPVEAPRQGTGLRTQSPQGPQNVIQWIQAGRPTLDRPLIDIPR